MDATDWTVIGSAIAILIAIATAFGSLRSEMWLFREHVDNRIEGLLEGLREAISGKRAA